VTEPVPALELYSGFFFKILGKAIRSGEFDDGIDITILSAEYGLVDAETPISWYDRRMDAERARELRSDVTEALADRVEGDYERVVLNLGKTYRQAVTEFARESSATVERIEGGGIGEKGHALKRFIRGDDGVLSSFEMTSPTPSD
jgi:hypothetical protein